MPGGPSSKILLDGEIGFIKAGVVRKAIKAGDITYNDCLTVMPFNNMATMVKCKDQIIKDAHELDASRFPEENGGFIHGSGLTYTINSSIPSSVQFDDKNNFVSVN